MVLRGTTITNQLDRDEIMIMILIASVVLGGGGSGVDRIDEVREHKNGIV